MSKILERRMAKTLKDLVCHCRALCFERVLNAEVFPGRFMRYLATHHVYREVSPNVFAHTRISSMLNTLKPSAEVIAE
jgi:hypothetical protein